MDNENFIIQREEITYIIVDGYPAEFRSTTRKSLDFNDDIYVAFPEDNIRIDNPKKHNHRRKHIREHYDEDLFYLLDEETAEGIAEFIAEKANTTHYGKTCRDEYEKWEEYVDAPTTSTYRKFVMWYQPATHWKAEHFMKEWNRQRD